MKKLLALMCIVCLGFVFTVGCGEKAKDKPKDKGTTEKKDTPPKDATPPKEETKK
jgi:hypothetical protein